MYSYKIYLFIDVEDIVIKYDKLYIYIYQLKKNFKMPFVTFIIF